jgi:hypothetical protein
MKIGTGALDTLMMARPEQSDFCLAEQRVFSRI